MRTILLSLLSFLGLITSTAAWAGYLVGASKMDITPTYEEAAASCLGGYGGPFFRCGSPEVLDGISARAISIRDHDTRALYLAVDTVGLGDSLIDEVTGNIEGLSMGMIKATDIHLTATHTHAGPDLQGLWGGVHASYRERVVKALTYAGLEALFSARRANLEFSETSVAVENRRGWPVVDDRLRVLRFRVAGEKNRSVSIINMSAHPTILAGSNTAYSAGFVDALRDTYEEKTGDLAIFINGIMGDAQPSGITSANYASAVDYGETAGRAAVESLEKKIPIAGDFHITRAEFSLPVENAAIGAVVAAGLLDLDIDENYRVHTYFTRVSFGKKLSGLTFPGESLTRNGLPLLRALPSEHSFFFGLTGNTYGYFVPSDEFLQIEGRNIEERVSLSPSAGDAARDTVLQLIAREKQPQGKTFSL